MSSSWFEIDRPGLMSGNILLILLAQGTWTLLALIILFIFGMFSLQNHFIISYIGLLSVLQVFAPTDEVPRWWWISRVVIVVGHVVFAIIIYNRIADISTLIS